ncbi:hypothetical protein AFAEC_0568 [Aliarcobacter faecis]|uniref:DUF6694 family lipoprotein n=1 Tax=Aliarcobacter faecis TaxID=1564138 RepID=UPI00047EB463|nr:DUF6694 family lipoprotein [Aliarcobacter faecis]QKF72759.1 hypothetical protein AFAEC_0568 [Aliarcobacter faecis]
MLKISLSSILLALLLIGCGTPRIDTSNDEKMKSSIQEVKKSLTVEKQKEFDEALQIILFSQINFKNILLNMSSIDNLNNDVKVLLNNKTADEVIQEATKIRVAKIEEEKKIKEAKLEEEKKRALAKIKELEEKKLNIEKSKEILKKIEILSASFEQKTIQYSNLKEPIINLQVKNSTDKAISKIYFEGTVKSIGREIPWITETFNYSIPGGLEVGEIANWSLSPNMFSKWGNVETPKDVILEVEVLKINGADEKEIASIIKFTSEDEEKLKTLKEKYN